MADDVVERLWAYRAMCKDGSKGSPPSILRQAFKEAADTIVALRADRDEMARDMCAALNNAESLRLQLTQARKRAMEEAAQWHDRIAAACRSVGHTLNQARIHKNSAKAIRSLAEHTDEVGG